ncbi:MAG: SPASM domain-containing protein [Candidatus Kariarchaeaceae archaeon]|jgi:uncharacterized protein
MQDEFGKIIGKKQWDQKNLSTDDREVFQQLHELGFLVGDEVNEAGFVKKTLWEWKLNTETLEIMVLPTYWCNLSCSYCYQRKFDRSLTMSEEICNQMLGWIENKLEEFRSRELKIKLLGGEALGKIALLERICSRLNEIALRKGVELNFDLTTNGTLLNSNYVRKIKTWGVDTVNITIDGEEKTHNLSRPFSNGKGSFQRIVKNIIEQCDKLNINLRCNYSQRNIDNIPRLLDYLSEKNLNTQLKNISFQPVIHRSDFTQSENNQHCNRAILTSQQIEQILWLTKKALDRGFQANTALTGGRCPAFFKSSFSIDPSGDIYKCPAFLGAKQNSIGNVYHQYLNYQNETFLMDDSWNDCLDCTFVPICCGGCRYAAKERFGNFSDKIICEKEYFEKVGLEFLKLANN